MSNKAKATSTLNKKTNATHEDAAISGQQLAEQQAVEAHKAKLGVAKGLLECCRKRGVSVTACNGTFE
ncbi:MAG: hypothetical protein Q8L69_17485 [Gallionellaceae bacterium]|nr:hypothetical protein [Gallionellaceae bacterium]